MCISCEFSIHKRASIITLRGNFHSLLRFAVRPVLMGTALAVPVALVLGSAWSFAGSFFWEEGAESTWGESVGWVSVS